MVDRTLAALVLVLHLSFILFVVAGGLFALRWNWAFFAHLPAAIWGVYIELSDGLCPLTPLENALRRSAGASGYSGSFIEHYLLSLIYPVGLTPTVQLVLASCVVLANILVYLLVWRVRRQRKQLAA